MYAMSENMGMVQEDCNPLVNIKFHGCSSPQICRRRTSTASGISRYIGAPGHTAGFAHGTQAFFLHVMTGGVLLDLLTHMWTYRDVTKRFWFGVGHFGKFTIIHRGMQFLML